MKMKRLSKSLGCSKGGPKRKVYSNTSLSQETRKVSNTQPTLHLKELEKEQQRKPKPSRRREIIKIRAEMNEIETKRAVEPINKIRSRFFERIRLINPWPDLPKRKEKGPK